MNIEEGGPDQLIGRGITVDARFPERRRGGIESTDRGHEIGADIGQEAEAKLEIAAVESVKNTANTNQNIAGDRGPRQETIEATGPKEFEQWIRVVIFVGFQSSVCYVASD